MKRSAKANAITNSPFVRALIQPVMRKIVPPAPLPPPSQADLIPTQPTSATPTAATPQTEAQAASAEPAVPMTGVSEKAAGKKRAREEDQAGPQEGEGAEEVIVRYTKDNLPQELQKCK